MKNTLLIICFITSLLTLGSCSSDDNSNSQPTSKEALEKKLLGEWERYKITNVHTKEEINPDDYFMDSIDFFYFKELNYVSFQWKWFHYDENYPFDTGTFTALSEKSIVINPADHKEDPRKYTVLSISKNELTLHLDNNEMEAQEHFKRVK